MPDMNDRDQLHQWERIQNEGPFYGDRMAVPGGWIYRFPIVEYAPDQTPQIADCKFVYVPDPTEPRNIYVRGDINT